MQVDKVLYKTATIICDSRCLYPFGSSTIQDNKLTNKKMTSKTYLVFVIVKYIIDNTLVQNLE